MEITVAPLLCKTSGTVRKLLTNIASVVRNGELEIVRQKACRRRRETISSQCWSKRQEWISRKQPWPSIQAFGIQSKPFNLAVSYSSKGRINRVKQAFSINSVSIWVSSNLMLFLYTFVLHHYKLLFIIKPFIRYHVH